MKDERFLAIIVLSIMIIAVCTTATAFADDNSDTTPPAQEQDPATIVPEPITTPPVEDTPVVSPPTDDTPVVLPPTTDTDVTPPEEDDEQIPQTPVLDKCAGVVCNVISVTCPDGFVVTCNEGCDSATGACILCKSSCSEHESTDKENKQPIGVPITSCKSEQTPAIDGVGHCSVFPTSCLPTGWTRVSACKECEDRKCDDGSIVACRLSEYGCVCDPCPIRADVLPIGCRQETDTATGVLRVVCDKQTDTCPVLSNDNEEAKEKCNKNGGTYEARYDNRGCKFIECVFYSQQTTTTPFKNYESCPTREDWESSSKKCADIGGRIVTSIEGGCNIPRCVNEQKGEEKCGLVPGPERERIENDCKSKGQDVIMNFDSNGCQFIMCKVKTTGIEGCMKDPPKEMFEQCKEKGGEVVIKRDNDGCMKFTECVSQGDSRDIYVGDDEITDIPESSELLSMAFKLETLRIEFDKLATQSTSIADYYKSTGSGEEEKYRRVAGMFDSMKSKVDEIKNKLRSRLETISRDDLVEIKSDIKYIKNVMLKDVLYLMLSSDNDIKDIATKKEGDCGGDDRCFYDAFRICKPVTFMPSGDKGMVVTIIGLEDNKCLMKVVRTDPQAGEVGMTCKVEKYSLGISNPEKDLAPYCEGPLLETLKGKPPEMSTVGPTREPTGCEQVKSGQNEKNVCGNQCCEPDAEESAVSCPEDCNAIETPHLAVETTNQVETVSSEG
ncbi:MAG: hypothetical protein ABIA21_03915 [Candidatus Aenigmatarchaeota archaeon]